MVLPLFSIGACLGSPWQWWNVTSFVLDAFNDISHWAVWDTSEERSAARNLSSKYLEVTHTLWYHMHIHLLRIWEFFLGRSFSWCRNRIGPPREPWVMTSLIACASDDWPLTTAFIHLPDKKDLITEKLFQRFHS